MKERVKTAIAFAVLALLLLVGAVMTVLDRPEDLYPDGETDVMLYGEAHGFREYYEIELSLWEKCYREGDRDLFVELPYYSAEFLNLWMKEDGDGLLDALFAEIRGTLSGNDDYRDFLRKLKAACPETVFHGTDVGHQFDTTGRRYLRYLEEHGLKDSENYRLAAECIRQGKEYDAVRTPTGISPVREKYMISNFLEAYARLGGKRIMGIYGSYHINLKNPEVMGYKIREQLGDAVRISSVKLSSLATAEKPYAFGLSVTGPAFLLMLFVPNILWARRKKPAGYEEAAKRENKLLLLLERTGEAGVTVCLLIFSPFDPAIRSLPEGVFINLRIWFWGLSVALMILYEFFWIKYFRSEGRMEDFYSSLLGFPVAGATLPVISILVLGIYSGNLILVFFALVLGVGHIGIHLAHRKEVLKA